MTKVPFESLLKQTQSNIIWSTDQSGYDLHLAEDFFETFLHTVGQRKRDLDFSSSLECALVALFRMQ